MSSHQSLPTLSPEHLQEYKGHRLIIAATIFLIIDVTFVGLRFYARRLQRQKLSWDDWILIPAFSTVLGSIIIAYLSINYGGVGRHIDYVIHHPDKIVFWYKSCIIALPFNYLFSVSLPKFSILGLYLHIFRDKPSRWIVYATMFAIGINVIIMTGLVAYRCNPVSYGWRSLLGEKVPGAWCVNVQPRFVWGSFVNIITDVVMMVLPIPLLWQLQMNKTHKLGLSIMFGLGGIGIIASCMRFAAFYSTEVLRDATWAAVELIAWCIVEPSIYLMAACMLTFGPLATRVIEKVSTSISKIRSQGSTSGQMDVHRNWAEKPGKHLPRFTPNKSLFSTQISTYQVGSDLSTNMTSSDDSITRQKNVIHIQRSFDVESYAMESPHEEFPKSSETGFRYVIAS